jgi:hypothetical protein
MTRRASKDAPAMTGRIVIMQRPHISGRTGDQPADQDRILTRTDRAGAYRARTT